MKEMYLINFVNFALLLPIFLNTKQFLDWALKWYYLHVLAVPVNHYFSSWPYMKKLHELHCKDGAGTVDIKHVYKTLPLQRGRPIF